MMLFLSVSLSVSVSQSLSLSLLSLPPLLLSLRPDMTFEVIRLLKVINKYLLSVCLCLFACPSQTFSPLFYISLCLIDFGPTTAEAIHLFDWLHYEIDHKNSFILCRRKTTRFLRH